MQDAQYWKDLEARSERAQDDVRESAAKVRDTALKCGSLTRISDNTIIVSARWYDLPPNMRREIVAACVQAVDDEEITVVDAVTGAVVGLAFGFQFREFPRPVTEATNG